MAAIALPILEATGVVMSSALRPAPHRDLCTDCGLSRTAHPERCGTACQFIHPDYDRLETQVHGRPRDASRGVEAWVGPYLTMRRARLNQPLAGAQWTGITTRLAERLLEDGMVDGVIATAADPDDRWKPRPVLVTRAADMAQCRGMKMGFSPVLALLEDAARQGLTRIALIGVACQVHALRAIEAELGFTRLLVIGTPCSDNASTESFHQLLGSLTDRPDEVTYFEFRSDARVELRFADGTDRFIPSHQLPLGQLPADFVPLTCRSCFDYTNALADITVGYMGGDGEQWVLVRNARGREILDALGDEITLDVVPSAGTRARAVDTYLTQVAQRQDGLAMRRAPQWAAPLMAWLQRRFGPRGLEFAKTRVEMKAGEGILTLRAERPKRVKSLVPDFAWKLVAQYGLTPTASETPTTRTVAPSRPKVLS